MNICSCSLGSGLGTDSWWKLPVANFLVVTTLRSFRVSKKMRSLIFQHLLTLFGRWYCMDMCTITLHSVYIHPPLAASFFMHCLKNRGGRWPRFATERSVKKHYILLFCQNMESPFSTVCRATAGSWNICAHADMKGVVLHAKIWHTSTVCCFQWF